MNKHFGGRTELIDPQQIRELVPTLNMNPADLPILAGLWHMDGATAAVMMLWRGVMQKARHSVVLNCTNLPK
ncbi:hypothetical protein P4S70_15545 [Enterovibrio sp. Hal110]